MTKFLEKVMEMTVEKDPDIIGIIVLCFKKRGEDSGEVCIGEYGLLPSPLWGVLRQCADELEVREGVKRNLRNISNKLKGG